MPTYLNSNADAVNINGQWVQPNKSFQTPVKLLTLPTGVTKTADTPVFDPVVSSQRVTGSSGDTTVTIPTTFGGKNLDRFMVKIFCATGRILVKLNDTSATARYILAGETVEYRCDVCPIIFKLIATIDSVSSDYKVDVLAI